MTKSSNQQYLYGLHAVSALLKEHPERILHLYVQKEKQDQRMVELLDKAAALSIKISWTTKETLARLSNNSLHQGVVALSQIAKTYEEEDLKALLANLKEPAFLLILDNIQDPHNLGACLRTAEAASVHAVIAPKDKSVGLTPTVCKVASGAQETIPFIQVTNLARTMRFLRDNNIWLFGASLEGSKNYFEEKLTVPLAIVLGAEGEGMRRLTREHCDALLKIPMQGQVESLNVSVASGIFLFEVVRQRISQKSFLK